MDYQKEQVKSIKESYSEKELTKFDELKALNKKVLRAPRIFAYVFGSVGSLILGAGMCMAMKQIFASFSWAMPVGIVVGLIGILLVSVNYPLYKKILNKRKKKYADKIFALSDQLLND